jgi:tetratricopeptide (TPR) repeat protein
MLRTWILLFSLLLAFGVCYPTRVFAQDNSDKKANPRDTRKDDKDTTSARETELSSSKDTRIDLTPPRDDAKDHPNSGAAIQNTEESPSDVEEMQPWDPHRAAKDLEVGDYYYKRKNYRGAAERYKDALTYKPNDAVANFRLAECEEKTGNSSDAVQHYQAYLTILPEGPFAADAKKALERLKSSSSK